MKNSIGRITRIRIGTKIFINSLIILIISISVTGFLIYRLTQSGEIVDDIHRNYAISDNFIKAGIVMLNIERQLMEVELAAKKKNVPKILQIVSEILTSDKSIRKYLTGVEKNIRGKEIEKYFSLTQKEVKNWGSQLTRLLKHMKNENFPEIIKSVSNLRNIIEAYISVSDIINARTATIVDESYNNSRKSIDESLMISGIVSFIMIIIAIIISIILTKSITRSLSIFKGIFTKGTSGNLDARFPFIENSRDEINSLGKLFNDFMDQLTHVIEEAVNTSRELGVSSEELSAATVSFSDNSQNQAASSEEITATMEEISAGIDNISDNTRYQFEKLNELIDEMKQLSDIIREMGVKITDAQGLSKNISGMAISGDQSLQLMNKSMNTISESSGKVTDIISIINDISDKINLLSLNAAIEAARAGDAGRGFAVVADEISKLADQTASSISDIDSLIKSNNSEIGKGMKNVVDTIENLSNIIEGVESISSMMDQIYEKMEKQQATNDSVNRNADELRIRSDEVRIATGEQRNAVGEVMKSITNINELNQSIASGSEQITASTAKLALMAENLKTRVDFFKF